MLANLAAYLSISGEIGINDIRKMSYSQPKMFIRSYMQFLRKNYPGSSELIDHITLIKSFGYGYTMPEKLMSKGIKLIENKYTKKNEMNANKKYDFKNIKVFCNQKQAINKTFSINTFNSLKNLFRDNNANMILNSYRMDEEIKSLHPGIDFLELCKRRMKREPLLRQIDDRESPLLPDIIEFSLHGLSVLNEANFSKDQFAVALQGIAGTHAKSDHEQEYSYFNNEIVFALQNAKSNKKILILDLDANFSHAMNEYCNHENILYVGFHADPNVDCSISSRNTIQNKNICYNLEIGINGEKYLSKLKNILDNINYTPDIFLILGSVNSYIFDNTSLLLVECQYFSQIGNLLGKFAQKNQIKKIILAQGRGFEKDSHILFAELCTGINDIIKDKG